MESKVLLLNADFTALGICSVSKAFLLVYLNKAELVSADTQNPLRSVSRSYPRPTVIRLLRYVNYSLPRSIALTSHNVFRRDGYKCQYCGSKQNLTIDHVVPRAQGGQHNWKNVTTACLKCNSIKGSRTPDQANMPLKMQPFKPNFVMFLRQFSGQLNKDWMTYLVH